MKKILSVILITAALFALLALPSGSISGQTSYSVTTIYPGITSTHITTGSNTTYGLQDMKIVEFDPKQEGLSVNVTTGYENLNRLSTVSNTLNRWNAAHPDKTPIVAINGDWFTVGYDSYSTAMTKTQLNIPLGFNMHGGEIITTQQTEVEYEISGYAPSFGVASDGTPLIGCIDTTTILQNGSTNINLDGINRLPANNAIIMYTDKGPASNYCLDDAYEIYVDFDFDYTVKHGMSAIGTVTAISAPNEARLPMQANRMIITARGSRISEISSIPVGKRLRFKVSINDRYGNTAKWQTVTDCVGGHHEFARNGTYFNIGDATKYPANIIGITAAGKVIFLCNDGRQSGYSLGVSINQMDDLAQELGIVSGIYMDGGGSTTMVQLNSSGGYTLVNRPCNTNNAERTVSNAVILAYDNRPLMVTDDLLFDTEDYTQYLGSTKNVSMVLTDGGLLMLATANYDPYANLKNFGLSADEYKYIVLDAKTTYTSQTPMQLGFYLTAGATTGPTEYCKASASLAASGESEKLILDLSSLTLWNGDIHGIRVDIFDDFSTNPDASSGNGIFIREMKFCRTLDEAMAMIKLPGDANSDGKVNSRDVTLYKRYMTGAITENDISMVNSDIDGDGRVNSRDFSQLKRIITGNGN